MNLDGSTVLLTGASEGIGLEMARILASRARLIVLVARSEERLEAVASELACETRVVALDLSVPGCVEQLLSAVEDLEIDVLINNAGASRAGPFSEQEPDEIEKLLRLLAVTPTLLMNRIVTGMLARDRGAILNVGSVAGMQPIPFMLVYAAAKGYLNHASQALSSELAGTPVTVTCLAPGSTHTDFHEKAGMPVEKAAFGAETAVAVARNGIAALERGKCLRVSGFANKLMVFGQRFVPRALVIHLAKRMFQWVLRKPTA